MKKDGTMATTDSQYSVTREQTKENLYINAQGNVAIEKLYLNVQGKVGSLEAPNLERKLNEALDKKPDLLVLDMSLVNFLSSGGIRVLLNTYKKALSAGKKFRIAHPSENVINVLGMVALDEMLLEG